MAILCLAVSVVLKNILLPDVQQGKDLVKVLLVGLVLAVQHHRWVLTRKAVLHIGLPLCQKDQAVWN